MVTALKLITAEELLRMPRNDGHRYELLRGVLVEKMATGDPHRIAVGRIALALATMPRPTTMAIREPANRAIVWKGIRIRCAPPM